MRGQPAQRRFCYLISLLSVLAGCTADPDLASRSAAGDTTSADADATRPSDTALPAEDASEGDALDAEPEGSDASGDTTMADGSAADAAEGSDAASSDSSPPEPEGPWVEMGQGEFAFAPVDDASSVPCTFGPQGSYHVWAAIRLHNIAPEAIRIETEALMDGMRVGAGFAAPLDSEWTVNPDGTADLFGQFLYLDFGIDFPARSDQSVTLTATVSGPSIHSVFATATGRFSCLQ